jgi:hypothetical protein
MTTKYTALSLSYDTRDTLRALKRGGESWDTLLEKMAKQYEPRLSADEK